MTPLVTVGLGQMFAHALGVSGYRGVIVALTATHAVLREEDREVYLSHAHLPGEVFEQDLPPE